MTALNRFATFLALGLLAMPLAALAETKLGWIDMQRALEEIDEGKAAKAQLKKDFEEKQKQLDMRASEVKSLDADFQKQQLVMAPDAKQAKAAEIERKKVEVQQFFMALQQDLSNREREITRGIFDKLVGVAREIAEAEGFSMVVDRNAVVYAPPALDISNEVVRKYNVRYPTKKADAPAPVKKADAPAPTKK